MSGRLTVSSLPSPRSVLRSLSLSPLPTSPLPTSLPSPRSVPLHSLSPPSLPPPLTFVWLQCPSTLGSEDVTVIRYRLVLAIELPFLESGIFDASFWCRLLHVVFHVSSSWWIKSRIWSRVLVRPPVGVSHLTALLCTPTASTAHCLAMAQVQSQLQLPDIHILIHILPRIIPRPISGTEGSAHIIGASLHELNIVECSVVAINRVCQ